MTPSSPSVGIKSVALDTATGRERWRTDVNQVTHYEPVLDGRTVLVSADDRFVAFERASGARRWETPVGEHAGGSVLTRVATGPIALVTTERGFVASLDGGTGQAVWSEQLPGDIWAAPAADATTGVGAVLWTGADDEAVNRLRVFEPRDRRCPVGVDRPAGSVRARDPRQLDRAG